MKFLKSFLRGLLYVVLSPLIIAGFALYAVYSVFVYLVTFFIATIRFFSGNKLTTDLKQDKTLKKFVKEKKEEIKEEKEKEKEIKKLQLEQSLNPKETNSGSTTINNFYISPEQFKNNFSAELRQNIPQQEVKYIESNDSKGGDNNE